MLPAFARLMRSALRRSTLCFIACALCACARRAPAVLDLDGKAIDPLANPDDTTVLVFSSTECPIGNRYAPELTRLASAFARQRARFWLVYPNARDDARRIRKHIADYALPGRPVRDPDHLLVRRAGAKVTPEAAVFRPHGGLAYLGRIDDQFVALGTARNEATTHDLENALRALASNQTVDPDRTQAVGCAIAD
jgi:hypothetical protein